MTSPLNMGEATVTAKANAEARPRRSTGAVVPMRHSGLCFVLSTDRRPLTPCPSAYARRLLRDGQAAVFKRFPFTIILKARTDAMSTVAAHRLKVDPGSKTTGIAMLRDETVVFAAELAHRGHAISKALLTRRRLRRSRRNRKTRYRAPRFANRRRPEGWLAPSLAHRVRTTMTWVRRLMRLCPVASLSIELARFDTQKMQNPELSGIEYQRGTLQGYEVREYLLEKWERRCAYCQVQGGPLEVEHIVPTSRGGSDRVSNLTLACRPCNEAKGAKTAAEFGALDIEQQANKPLKDAAVINASRWALSAQLRATGLSVECGTGGRTTFNRTRLGLPKAHWIDAACVGASTPASLSVPACTLTIVSEGHGHRQMCGTDKYGFPIRHRTRTKRHGGFQTGDIVRATVPSGRNAGTHIGRVLCRATGRFDIRTRTGRVTGISSQHCQVIHRQDGYRYAIERGGASSPRLKPRASAPFMW